MTNAGQGEISESYITRPVRVDLFFAKLNLHFSGDYYNLSKLLTL